MSGNWNFTASINDYYTSGITTVTSRKRYLLSFGGYNKHSETPADNKEYIRRLDCFKENKGWQIICLQNPQSQYNGESYGIINLGFADNSDDVQEFLIFGGYNVDCDDMQ